MALTKEELQQIDRDIIDTGRATVPATLLEIMTKGAANTGKSITVTPSTARPGWFNVVEG